VTFYTFRDVAAKESSESEKLLTNFIPDLGVGLLPDASPETK